MQISDQTLDGIRLHFETEMMDSSCVIYRASYHTWMGKNVQLLNPHLNHSGSHAFSIRTSSSQANKPESLIECNAPIQILDRESYVIQTL